MKRKKIHKKKQSKQSQIPFAYRKYLIIASFCLLIFAVAVIVHSSRSSTQVLGTSTYLADKENSQESGDTSGQEKTDQVEPTDAPEARQQTEQVQKEVERQIETKNVNEVEVQPAQESSGSGKVILQQRENTKELSIPVSSTTPITQISNPQAGTVSVHVGGANNIVIDNGPYIITTQYPVVINPTDQTLAIKTPSGVTLIKTFPTQVFQSLPEKNKLTSVSSLNLTDQQGTPIYQANGIQVRKFLGVIPVQATVEEQINAQNGQVVSSDLPWYFSLFGFAFQSV